MCVPGHFALLHNAQGVRYFITLKHPLIRCQKTCRFGTQAPLPSTRCKHRPGKTRSWILASRLFKATLAIIRAKPACFLAAHPRAAGAADLEEPAAPGMKGRREGGLLPERGHAVEHRVRSGRIGVAVIACLGYAAQLLGRIVGAPAVDRVVRVPRT